MYEEVHYPPLCYKKTNQTPYALGYTFEDIQGLFFDQWCGYDEKVPFCYCLNIRSFFHGGLKMRHQYYSARIELMI